MDKLFLLKPDFQNPQFPARKFFCWQCALLEGVLKMYPFLEKRLEVHRIDWSYPRYAVISEVGPENQSLPLLVLSNGRGFIADKDGILQYLSDEYGIAEVHP